MSSKKRPLHLACIATLYTAIAFISACSSNNETAATPKTLSEPANLVHDTGQKITTPTPQTYSSTIAVSGRVLNVGYLKDTIVCFDLNDNGSCDTHEPRTISDSLGRYDLTIPKGHRGASLLAVVSTGSQDSAHSTDNPIQFSHGWTLPTQLEYEDNAETVIQNITLVSMVNYARQRVRGRSRESNSLNTFRRLVGEPNIDPTTSQTILPIDFDYVNAPKNDLSERLYSFYALLEKSSLNKASTLTMLDVTAYGYAFYNAYENASETAPLQSANTIAITAEIEEGTDITEAFISEDHRYFRTNTDAITQLRIGLTETTGWSRAENSGELETIGRRSFYLKNGKAALTFEQWENENWQPITVTEEPTFTLSPEGQLVVIGPTDSQQPRTISAVDGNRISMRMPGNNARVAYDLSNSPGTNFFIEEWVDEQQSINWYYPEQTPLYDPFTERPSCAKNYPNYRHQPRVTNDGLSNWYTQCFDYFTAEYYSEVLGDIALTYEDPELPGATFYDITLLDPIVIFPATKSCGEAHEIASIKTNNLAHCNWAIDTQGGHAIEDLFTDNGVRIHSWNNVYGESEFEVDDAPVIAGTEAQKGQPQQLKLTLDRQANATSGTGTIYSPYGGWTAGSHTELEESIVWEQSTTSSNLILIEFPFRDANNPLVPSNTQSDGITPAVTPAVLSGARQSDRSRSTHFTATWNNSTFRMDQSTHSSINREKIAVYLTDEGHFIVGQYFERGYTFSERYFNTEAFDEGVKGMQYILDKLFGFGWIDQVPQPAEVETIADTAT